MTTFDEAVLTDPTDEERALYERILTAGGYLASPLPPDGSSSTWMVRISHPLLGPDEAAEGSGGSRGAALAVAVDEMDRALAARLGRRAATR